MSHEGEKPDSAGKTSETSTVPAKDKPATEDELKIDLKDNDNSLHVPAEESLKTTSSEDASNDGYFDADMVPAESNGLNTPAVPEKDDTIDRDGALVTPALSTTTSMSIDQMVDNASDSTSNTNATKRSAPTGWKGWLRSASATSLSPALTRRSIIADAAPMPRISSLSIKGSPREALEALKLRLHMNSDPAYETIDWSTYELIVHAEHPKSLPSLRNLIQQGLPDCVRGIVWQCLTDSKNAELEAVYADLVNEKSDADRQIKKDVQRLNKTWIKALEESRA